MKNNTLETLIVAFYGEMQCARACRRNGYTDLAEQAMHQAFGIRTAAECLGIDYEVFMDEYKSYRTKMRMEAAI